MLLANLTNAEQPVNVTGLCGTALLRQLDEENVAAYMRDPSQLDSDGTTLELSQRGPELILNPYALAIIDLIRGELG